jgi:hypothetical protein
LRSTILKIARLACLPLKAAETITKTNPNINLVVLRIYVVLKIYKQMRTIQHLWNSEDMAILGFMIMKETITKTSPETW